MCCCALCLSSSLKKHIFLQPIKAYCLLHLTCLNSIIYNLHAQNNRHNLQAFYCYSKLTNFLITQMSMQTQIRMVKLSWLISDFFVDQFFVRSRDCGYQSTSKKIVEHELLIYMGLLYSCL